MKLSFGLTSGKSKLFARVESRESRVKSQYQARARQGLFWLIMQSSSKKLYGQPILQNHAHTRTVMSHKIHTPNGSLMVILTSVPLLD